MRLREIGIVCMLALGAAAAARARPLVFRADAVAAGQGVTLGDVADLSDAPPALRGRADGAGNRGVPAGSVAAGVLCSSRAAHRAGAT